MKFTLLLPMLLFFSLPKAQNSTEIKRIDSVVGIIAEKASSQKHKIVEGSLLLEGNKTSSIRFLLDSNRVEMIIVESSLKDNLALYYFDNKKLLYTVTFTNGNYNEIESSFYFINNGAYKKLEDKFEKVNPDFFAFLVSTYLELFKEQLKAN